MPVTPVIDVKPEGSLPAPAHAKKNATAAPSPNDITRLAPGTIPPPARILTLPDIVQKPYFEVFPDAAPKPAENAPGVFINEDGTVYTPRERTGGQFSAMLLQVTNKYTGRTRQSLLPLNTLVDNYGVNKATERVTERVEVVFDFEDEMQAALEAFGHKSSRADPLAARLAAKGYAGRFDDAATSPGHGID